MKSKPLLKLKRITLLHTRRAERVVWVKRLAKGCNIYSPGATAGVLPSSEEIEDYSQNFNFARTEDGISITAFTDIFQ